MTRVRGGRGGAARPQVPTTERSTHPTGPTGHRGPTRRRLPARGRLGALFVAAAAIAVVGAACGQYPNVQGRGASGFDEQPAAVAAPQPPSSPVSGVDGTGSSTDTTTTTTKDVSKADGAEGPGAHAIRGGSGSVDLSKVFPVGSKSSGGNSGSNAGSTSSKGSSSSKGSTTSKGSSSSKTSTTSKGSTTSTGGKGASGSTKGSGNAKGSGINGDDGSNPGTPDITGSIGPGSSSAGSLDLATLISRETERGAQYNSTILPAGFPFSICPVQGKYSYSDSYGAPRYAGGYHPHAGVDVFADQGTPIAAPFDGYAERDPNTLGGNAVIVRGAQGYVYMAHLVAYGITDQNVKAGDVVGFVGNTGDAQGTSYHDHFEWHPNNVAPYDRVISGTNGAVDPFPYLQVVCPPQPS